MTPQGSLALQRCYSYYVPTSYSPMLAELIGVGDGKMALNWGARRPRHVRVVRLVQDVESCRPHRKTTKYINTSIYKHGTNNMIAPIEEFQTILYEDPGWGFVAAGQDC